MSKNWKTVVKGWATTTYSGIFVGIWEVVNWFYWSNLAPWKKMTARYIITMTEYLTRWVEAQPIKDFKCTMKIKFFFEYVLTRFGCPKVLMSDRGMNFLTETISTLTDEFQVYHQKIHHITHRKMELSKLLTTFWRMCWQISVMCSEMTGMYTYL